MGGPSGSSQARTEEASRAARTYQRAPPCAGGARLWPWGRLTERRRWVPGASCGRGGFFAGVLHGSAGGGVQASPGADGWTRRAMQTERHALCTVASTPFVWDGSAVARGSGVGRASRRPGWTSGERGIGPRISHGHCTGLGDAVQNGTRPARRTTLTRVDGADRTGETEEIRRSRS
jgi:hypothetical protein